MASNKRERELARMRAERQAARRAAEQVRRRQRRNSLLAAIGGVLVVAIVVVVVIVVVQNTGGGSKKTSTLASGDGNLGGTGTCTYTASGTSAKKISGLPPEKGVLNTGTQTATIATTRGSLTAQLLTSKAPCTVNSFVYLAQQKYFNNTKCHRLTTSGIYVLQCGDPTGTGTGGPGYKFADENLEGATYPAGTLAMANSGAGTNGSQFFIVYKDTQLPASYTPFGKVTAGLDVVTKVAAAGATGTTGDGAPKEAISLSSITVG